MHAIGGHSYFGSSILGLPVRRKARLAVQVIAAPLIRLIELFVERIGRHFFDTFLKFLNICSET